MADESVQRAMNVMRLAKQAGWPDALVRIAGAVAMAESSGIETARGDQNLAGGIWGDSLGLMQLRSMPGQSGTGGPRDAERIMDPLENMKAALELYEGRNFKSGGETWYEPGGWDQWSTYTSGAYENYLPLVERALGLVERAR